MNPPDRSFLVFFFLFLCQAIFFYHVTALLEIFHNYTNQHVEDHETGRQQKCHKKQHVPLVVVSYWLKK